MPKSQIHPSKMGVIERNIRKLKHHISSFSGSCTQHKNNNGGGIWQKNGIFLPYFTQIHHEKDILAEKIASSLASKKTEDKGMIVKGTN